MLVKRNVTLERATESDAILLANLLELYVHDLSEVFPIELGVDGRFGYSRLRSGIGRIAASLLFDHLPGHWVVRVSEANSAAVPFWESTISRYTRGAASKTMRPGKHHLFHVHSFSSADQGADG